MLLSMLPGFGGSGAGGPPPKKAVMGTTIPALAIVLERTISDLNEQIPLSALEVTAAEDVKDIDITIKEAEEALQKAQESKDELAIAQAEVALSELRKNRSEKVLEAAMRGVDQKAFEEFKAKVDAATPQDKPGLLQGTDPLVLAVVAQNKLTQAQKALDSQTSSRDSLLQNKALEQAAAEDVKDLDLSIKVAEEPLQKAKESKDELAIAQAEVALSELRKNRSEKVLEAAMRGVDQKAFEEFKAKVDAATPQDKPGLLQGTDPLVLAVVAQNKLTQAQKALDSQTSSRDSLLQNKALEQAAAEDVKDLDLSIKVAEEALQKAQESKDELAIAEAQLALSQLRKARADAVFGAITSGVDPKALADFKSRSQTEPGILKGTDALALAVVAEKKVADAQNALASQTRVRDGIVAKKAAAEKKAAEERQAALQDAMETAAPPEEPVQDGFGVPPLWAVFMGSLFGAVPSGFKHRDEWDEIIRIGEEEGLSDREVDILVAIREHEHGRAGREFGVMKGAPNFEKQARSAARLVLRGYGARLGTSEKIEDFIKRFGESYCPVGAENDPFDLNKYWIPTMTNLVPAVGDAIEPEGLRIGSMLTVVMAQSEAAVKPLEGSVIDITNPSDPVVKVDPTIIPVIPSGSKVWVRGLGSFDIDDINLATPKGRESVIYLVVPDAELASYRSRDRQVVLQGVSAEQVKVPVYPTPEAARVAAEEAARRAEEERARLAAEEARKAEEEKNRNAAAAELETALASAESAVQPGMNSFDIQTIIDGLKQKFIATEKAWEGRLEELAAKIPNM